MSIREYIGARYVPIFGRKDETSIAWDDSKPYEPLTIVLYQGNSYTSRQYVPAGIPITNEEFWALTGNYNAQVEAYRTEVGQFADAIETINDALPIDDFSESNTVKTYVDDQITDIQQQVETSIDELQDEISGVLTQAEVLEVIEFTRNTIIL